MAIYKQPLLPMKKSFFEKAFDCIALLLFGVSIVYLITIWSSIPSEVPIHYNFAGEPDGWGGKWTLSILPVIGLAMWIGLYFIEKYPHTHNYIGLTEENKERLYKNSQLLVNVMRNEIMIFIAYMTVETVRIARGHEMVLGAWQMPLFLVILFGSIAYLFARGLRLR